MMVFSRGDLIKSNGYTKFYFPTEEFLSNTVEVYLELDEIFIHKKIKIIFLGKTKFKGYEWLFDVFYDGKILLIDSIYLKNFKKIG